MVFKMLRRILPLITLQAVICVNHCMSNQVGLEAATSYQAQMPAGVSQARLPITTTRPDSFTTSDNSNVALIPINHCLVQGSCFCCRGLLLVDNNRLTFGDPMDSMDRTGLLHVTFELLVSRPKVEAYNKNPARACRILIRPM